MSTKNLASNKITVFPASRRSMEYDVSSKLFNESNVVSITNRLSSIKSYVVSSLKEMHENKTFSFVLGGYYFTVPGAGEILKLFATETISSITGIYAYIILDSGTQNPELAGLDENGVYLGVNFSTSTSSSWENSSSIYYLKVLEKVEGATTLTINDVTIPTESRYVFTDSTIKIDIDGGIIPKETLAN